MKYLRTLLLMGCAIMALAAAAQQPDPVIASINDAYQKAKEATKKNKSMGNEMVTTLNYTVRDQGKTTEELHFYYNTIQGTYAFVEDRDPHFFYYPLYFVTRSFNVGKLKYNEEYLFDSTSQRLLFAKTQDYDEQGKRYDRRFYFNEGSLYHLVGPPPTEFMVDLVIFFAEDLRRAFDCIIRNPKE